MSKKKKIVPRCLECGKSNRMTRILFMNDMPGWMCGCGYWATDAVWEQEPTTWQKIKSWWRNKW